MNTASNHMTDDNPHEGLEVRCLTETGTKTIEHEHNGEIHENEVAQFCDTVLTYESNYVGLAGTTLARREGYENDALKFRCPECGGIRYICPICSDSNSPGWFRGESTGDMIPCHNCNMEEVAAQERRGY